MYCLSYIQIYVYMKVWDEKSTVTHSGRVSDVFDESEYVQE